MATLYGTWIEWFVNKVESSLQERHDQLPKKAVKDGAPFIYFMALPLHENFDLGNGFLCNKFNNCLESVVKPKTGHEDDLAQRNLGPEGVSLGGEQQNY